MKADVKKLSAIDNAIALEQAIENLDELRSRLHQGARGSGATLTANECFLLANHIATPSRPKGHPTQDWTIAFDIAMRCLRHEREGLALKLAVTETAKELGVSRSAVYRARKELLSSSK